MSLRPSIVRLVAWVVIASMLAIATAPAWHIHAHGPTVASDGGCGHDGCGAEPSDEAGEGDASSSSEPGTEERSAPSKPDDHTCTICIVMNAPIGGSPRAAAVERVAGLIGVMVIGAPSDAPGVGSGPVLFACGPPSANG